MKRVMLAFFIWRTYLFAIAAIAPLILPMFQERFPYFQERLISTNLPHFIWSFGNFDGVHYLGIAANGYAAQFTQVFFPFYPITIKLISVPLSFIMSEKQSLLISALLISNTSFLLVLLVFYKLVRKSFNENIALWSAIFLTFFPTSFFFGSVYTESLFLLMVLGSFYLADKKLILASVIASISTLTRISGIFLAPTLNLKKKIPYFIVPIGLVIYMTYLLITFNNPFYFISGQSAFGNERNTNSIVLPPQVIFRYSKILLTTHGKDFLIAIFELFSTLAAVIILLLAFKDKKIKREWIIFGLFSVLLPTLTGTFSSMPRYIMVAFPIYIYLALTRSKYIKIMIVFIFIILLTILTALFTQGYWIA